jgi:hypothetical protein
MSDAFQAEHDKLFQPHEDRYDEYLAGPMRGYPENHYPLFNSVAANIRRTGTTVFNPAELYGGTQDRPFEDYMRTDEHVVEHHCNAIRLLPGWEKSEGSRRELRCALRSGIDVILDDCYASVTFGDFSISAKTTCSPNGETRVTNEKTGGQKGQKLARMDLVPVQPLWELAEHYGKGAKKYSDNNWRKGVAWSLNYSAALRHLALFWKGEDIDPETLSQHVIAAAWHCFALAEYSRTHPELDDRSKQ